MQPTDTTEYWYIPVSFVSNLETASIKLPDFDVHVKGKTEYVALPATPGLNTRLGRLLNQEHKDYMFYKWMGLSPLSKHCIHGFSYVEEGIEGIQQDSVLLHALVPNVIRQKVGVLKHITDGSPSEKPDSIFTFDVPKHMVSIECGFSEDDPFECPFLYLVSNTSQDAFSIAPLPFYNVFDDGAVCLGDADPQSFSELLSAYWDTPFDDELVLESDLPVRLTSEAADKYMKTVPDKNKHLFGFVEPEPKTPFSLCPKDEVIYFVKFPNHTRAVTVWSSQCGGTTLIRTHAKA